MKILILPDLTNNWSAHNRAKAIQKFIPEHEFTIRAGLNNESGGLHDQQNYDLIHFNFSYGLTGYYPFIMANKHRVVITIINERSFLAGYGVDPKQYEEILRTCPYVTSVSKKVADLVGCRYIPNGIDEDIFPGQRDVVVGYSGTGKENKNVTAIEEACRDLGLTFKPAMYSHAVNAGQLGHESMNLYYLALDVYVHASLTEGFNNTIIEALACNVPVIMTREGCWHEFEGWVEFVDPTAASIRKALQKYAGRRLITERFLWTNIIPQYRAIYEEAYQCVKT